jgi:hypothetical protein
MTIQVTISSIVGTSPYNLYVCQEDGSNCFYIDRITSEQLPYTFDIPAPYNNSESYMFKVVDDYGSVSTGTTNLYASPTPTSTVTPTITPSSSPTPTTTQTPTVTATVTITPTPSVSQSPGASPSVTPTNTFTPTLTSTLTPTPSVSETPGASPSPTSTFTPTLTQTPTVTETPSETPTPTVTPTPTISETPTNTPTNTPTPTVTPTTPADGWIFQYSNGAPTSAPLCESQGQTAFYSTQNFLTTYNPNITGGIKNFVFNMVDGNGTDYTTQFQNKVNNQGLIRIYQGSNEVVFDSNGAYSINSGRFFIQYTAPETLEQVSPTSADFNGGEPIFIDFNPSPTPTPTGTATQTPTVTPTSSVTPTNTPTITPTETPTNTPTPSITPSPQPPNPSLILDFDASDAINFTPTASEGVESSYWNNLVVGGLPFTGTSAFNSPIWETLPSYNNLGSLEFSSGKRLWTNLQNNFVSATGFTLFWVFNTTSLTTLQFILNTTTTSPSGGSGEIFAFMDSANSLELQYINSSVYRRFSWTTDVTLLTVVYDGSLSSAQRLKVRINGVDAIPSASGGNWPSSLNSFYGLNLSSVAGAFPLLGNIGAFKFYNSAIDTSEITSVENQLMTKFGI